MVIMRVNHTAPQEGAGQDYGGSGSYERTMCHKEGRGGTVVPRKQCGVKRGGAATAGEQSSAGRMGEAQENSTAWGGKGWFYGSKGGSCFQNIHREICLRR